MGDEAASQSSPVAVQTGVKIQTEADLNLVKRFLLLRIAVQILDHDIGIAGASRMKLPRLYESILRALQDRVLLDQAAAKREMNTGGIRILCEQRHAEGLTVHYAIRGYQHQFALMWPMVRREAEQVLEQYRQARSGGGRQG